MFIPSKETIICASGTTVSSIATALQSNEVFYDIQVVISIICGVCTLVSLLFGVIDKIVKWHKKAMEDGKIDDKEKEELKQIVSDDGSEIIKAAKDIADKTKEAKK